MAKDLRVLAISDRVVPGLNSLRIREWVGPVDLVLSCGDLPYRYLEFIATMLNVPCYFVAGNHDRPLAYDRWGQPVRGPGGWVNLDERVVAEGGLLLAGLAGSRRYNQRPHFQHTEGEMWLKVLGLVPRLLANRVRYGRYLDILITHAPPFGIHDAGDLCHTGFRSFLWLMRWFRPRYLIHGHIHVYRADTVRVTRYLSTQVVNAYGYRMLEVTVGSPGS
jgi:Icc-related predicted phosphoesterase